MSQASMTKHASGAPTSEHTIDGLQVVEESELPILVEEQKANQFLSEKSESIFVKVDNRTNFKTGGFSEPYEFKSLQELGDFYLKFPHRKRYLNEWIPSNQTRCKPYFDVDLKDDNEFNQDRQVNVGSQYLRFCSEYFGVDPQQVLMLDSSGFDLKAQKTKYSFHIIINGLGHTTPKVLKNIRNDLVAYAEENRDRYPLVTDFDDKVYNNGQNFRMIGCSKKPDPERILEAIAFDAKDQQPVVLFDTLVTYTKGLNELKWKPKSNLTTLICRSGTTKHRTIGHAEVRSDPNSENNMNLSEQDAIQSLKDNGYWNDGLEINGIDHQLRVCLKAKSPYMCALCKREHVKNSNRPCVFRTVDGLYFHCRQNTVQLRERIPYQLADITDSEPIKPKIRLKNRDAENLFNLTSQKDLSDLFIKENKQNVIVNQQGEMYFWVEKQAFWELSNYDRLFQIVADWIKHRCQPALGELQSKLAVCDDVEVLPLLKAELRALTKQFATMTTKTCIDSIIRHSMNRLVDPTFEKKRDGDRHVIHFQDVCFDLKTKTTRPRVRGDWATQILDDCYGQPKPDVRQEVERIVKEILNCDEMLFESVGQYLGYCLTGQTNQKCFLTLVGYKADNGKTTICTMFKHSLPIYTKQIDNKTFAQKYEKKHKVYATLSKPIRLAYVEELSKEAQDTSAIKAFADGQLADFEKLFGTTMSIELQAKLIICSNFDMKFETDAGMISRGYQAILSNMFISEGERQKRIESGSDPTNLFVKDDQIIERFKTNADYRLAFIDLVADFAHKFYDNKMTLQLDPKLKANFTEVADDRDRMTTFLDNGVIKGSDSDRVLRDDFVSAYRDYFNLTYHLTWSTIASDAKRCGLRYAKEEKIGGRRGTLHGIKGFLSDSTLDKNELISDS